MNGDADGRILPRAQLLPRVRPLLRAQALPRALQLAPLQEWHQYSLQAKPLVQALLLPQPQAPLLQLVFLQVLPQDSLLLLWTKTG